MYLTAASNGVLLCTVGVLLHRSWHAYQGNEAAAVEVCSWMTRLSICMFVIDALLWVVWLTVTKVNEDLIIREALETWAVVLAEHITYQWGSIFTSLHHTSLLHRHGMLPLLNQTDPGVDKHMASLLKRHKEVTNFGIGYENGDA